MLKILDYILRKLEFLCWAFKISIKVYLLHLMGGIVKRLKQLQLTLSSLACCVLMLAFRSDL